MQDESLDLCGCELCEREGLTIRYGYCHCGFCGEKTRISDKNSQLWGWVRGRPLRYISGHQTRKWYYEVDENGCWLWKGQIRGGYGRMKVNGKTVSAHCWYYEQVKGPIPEGMELDHLCHTADPTCSGGHTCRHRRCVNPDHLEPVTREENMRRGRKPALRTHCKKCGAEFTPENTARDGANGRRCRICRNAKNRRRYAQRKTRQGGS